MRRAGLGDLQGLARGDGADDEIRLAGQGRVAVRQRHAMLGRMGQQRRRLGAAELEVMGRDPDALGAQVLGQDAAHFTVADKADVPVARDLWNCRDCLCRCHAALLLANVLAAFSRCT